MGYSRQHVYKQQKTQSDEIKKMQVVKELVDRERKLLPRLGTRKIYYLIKADLDRLRLRFGRDKLFTLMAEHDLLIKPRRRYTTTTMSKHWLRKWPNLIKDLEITYPDQVWVSDITYLKTREGNCYLNMVTDMYSRRIMGNAIADNMGTESMIEAFKMATKQRYSPSVATIHHSDRGLQYCSKDYVAMAVDNNISLSMTENGDPYENALAERMNRTIKEEFGMDGTLRTKEYARILVKESIDLYNHKRPHLALNMKTPDNVYKTKSRSQKATEIYS
ncbi:IS3 family transposase [Chitinophaga terrae (ex Kim and Jung 2007)]|uniref:IS3 family transposase n=1 Tax=Chitinophaga terrae (ex Kim and Jung 2007) TaxID=408074 RepID=UPI0027D812A7|nr:IS3 family transposase [Chitinophaga terrae (ex Kim and Jung 2007)]